MGAKTGYADVILRCMGLRPGQGSADGTQYLWCEPDAGVRLLLHAYTDRELATAAAEIIRGWQNENPRELWERLRAEGPAMCPPVDAREVARCLQIIASNGLINVDTRTWKNTGAGGSTFGGVVGYNGKGLANRTALLPTLPATITADAREVDPREVARFGLLQGGCYNNYPIDVKNPSPDYNRFPPRGNWPVSIADAMVNTATIGATITDDARKVDPPQLPPGVVVYIDPPYRGTTGYAHAFARSEWLPVVRRWAAAGALVVVSEAEPIDDLLDDGWHAVEITGERVGQKRTFSKQQREWLTMSRPPSWRPSVQISLFNAGG